MPLSGSSEIARIHTKEDLKNWISAEEKIYEQNNTFITVIKSIIGSEKAILCLFQKRLRKTEYYLNNGYKIRYTISKIRLNHYRNKYALHIEPNVFGKGLKIMHLGPILTNSNVRTGENISIHINTALVAQGVTSGVPKLGNDIVIGVGAVILGDIEISDGIAIGANSVVNKSVSEKDIAIGGIPAHYISNNGKRKWK